jgi:chromosome segregation ATPase
MKHNIQDEIRLTEQEIKHLKEDLPQFRVLTQRMKSLIAKFNQDLIKQERKLKDLRARAKRAEKVCVMIRWTKGTYKGITAQHSDYMPVKEAKRLAARLNSDSRSEPYESSYEYYVECEPASQLGHSSQPSSITPN